MAIKQIRAKVGQTVDYKIIKDTYKTVTDRFVVSEDIDMVSNIELNAPTEKFEANVDYTIDQVGETKTISFNNDIVLPDDKVMEKGEFALVPYDGNVHFIPGEDNTPKIWNNNFNTVGSPQIVSGVVSNFSSSNYITLKNTFDSSKPWEMVFKFNLNVIDSLSKILLCHNSSGLIKLTIYEGKVEFGVSTTTSDWSIGQIVGKQILQPYKDYWVKAEFTGTSYNVYTSEDGIIYNLDGTIESSESFVMPNQLLVGNGGWQMNEVFTGVIDLNETYIKVDGEMWWKPECKNMTGWYSTVGSRGVIQGGIARSFSSDNCLKINKTFLADLTDWELKFKIKTGSDTYTNQIIFSCFGDINCPVALNVVYDHFAIYLTNSSTSWSIAQQLMGTYAVQKNCDYYVKMVYKNNIYKLSYSMDDIAYVDDITLESSQRIASFTPNIGCWKKTSIGDSPFLGSIDLNKSYIKMNNELLWSGTEYETIGYWNDEGVIKGFSRNNYMYILTTTNIIPFKNATSWEMVVKVITGEDISSQQNILVEKTADYNSCLFVAGNRFGAWITSGHTSATQVNLVPTETRTVLQPNTEYLVKFKLDGNLYTLETSIDNGETWNLDGSVESTLRTNDWQWNIGCAYTNNSSYDYPFKGYVDLNESYIIIDGKMWWKGIDKNTFKNAHFQMIGTPSIDINGCVFNFSTSNSIKSTKSVNNESEIFVTFKTSNTRSYIETIYVALNSSNTGVADLYILTDGNLATWNNSQNTDVRILPLAMNTIYSVKTIFNSSGRTIIVYDELGEVLSEIAINDSNQAFSTPTNVRFGYLPSVSDRYLRGSIDLTNTYIKTDGEMEYLYELNGKYLQGILDKETDAPTLKLFANTLIMEKEYGKITFQQPTISSVGVVGESDFACSTTKGELNNTMPLHNAFNNDNNVWHSAKGSSPWDIVYYSRTPIIPTKINITNRCNDASNVYPATSLTVYGSKDGSTYTQIGYTTNSNTSNAGKWSCNIDTPMEVNYLKFVFTNNYNYFAITYIGIEGTTYGTTTHKGMLLLSDSDDLVNKGLYKQYITDITIPSDESNGSDEEETPSEDVTYVHNYYAWTNTSGATPSTVYTLSQTPSLNDTIYDNLGQETTMVVVGKDSNNEHINPGIAPAFFMPPEYHRDVEKDIAKNDSPGMGDFGDFEEGDDFEML